MSDHKINAYKVNAAVRPVLNELHSREGVPIADINAALFGLVTCSMQSDVGVERARDLIESAMNNVWGKRPPNKLHERIKGFLFNKSKGGSE